MEQNLAKYVVENQTIEISIAKNDSLVKYKLFFAHPLKNELRLSFETTTQLQQELIPLLFSAFDNRQPVFVKTVVDSKCVEGNFFLQSVGCAGHSEENQEKWSFSPRTEPHKIASCSLTLETSENQDFFSEREQIAH